MADSTERTAAASCGCGSDCRCGCQSGKSCNCGGHCGR